MALMKDLFCVNEQLVTPHEGAVDGNGEFIFTCSIPECGRFVKFPADTDKDSFKVLVEKHEENNIGQVNIEIQQAKLAELIGSEEEPAVEE